VTTQVFVLFPPPVLRLGASHRNKIEVGCCASCVLAATTAAFPSAILDCENINARGVDRG